MKYSLLLVTTLVLAFSSPAVAQYSSGSVEIGAYFPYQRAIFSGDVEIETPGEKDSKRYIRPSDTYGFTVGGVVEYHFSRGVSLFGILQYKELHWHATQPGTVYVDTMPNGNIFYPETRYTASLSAPQIASTILGKFTLPSTKFSVLVGIHIGLLVADNQHLGYQLVSDPKNPHLSFDSVSVPIPEETRGQKARFTDDAHTSMIMYDGEIYKKNPVQIGITGGIQYDIPLFAVNDAGDKYVTLTPSILYDFGLTPYSDYDNTSYATALNLGLVVKMGL